MPLVRLVVQVVNETMDIIKKELTVRCPHCKAGSSLVGKTADGKERCLACHMAFDDPLKKK
jgi:uncharacterized protein (DUF983 family)